MFGFRGKRTRNIKIGFKGPTLHTGPRRTRIGSGFCDTIGEFLYEFCSAVLFKYGGYNEDVFEDGMWADYVSVRRCADVEVKAYAHEMIRIARTAIKQNQLIAFEVAIVDELDQPICTFTIHFRKNPDFREGALWQNWKAHKEFLRHLGKIIRNIQQLPITSEMAGLIATTASRLRIRLHIDESFKEIAEDLSLIQDSALPQSWHSEFVSIGDPVTNLFNQFYFTAIVRNRPTVNEQDDRYENYGW